MSSLLQPGGNQTMSGCAGTVIVTHDVNHQFDINLAAFLLTETGKVQGDNGFIYYNQPDGLNGVAKFTPPVESNHTKTHRIDFDLTKLPTGISKIAVTLSEDNQCGFSSVRNLKAEVRTANQIVQLTPGHFSTENGLIVLELYLRNNQPKVKAVWQGFAAGLESLCTHYGLAVDNNPPDPAPPPPPSNSILSKQVLTYIAIGVLLLIVLYALFPHIPLSGSRFTLVEIGVQDNFTYWGLLKLVIETVLFGNVLYAMWRWWMNHQTLSWPSVEGEIIHPTIEDDSCDDSYDGDDNFLIYIFDIFGLICASFSSYPIKINYRYTVSGINYQNKRFSYGQSRFYFSKTRQNVISQYPHGSRCPVYYHPDNPINAVISREPVSIARLFLTSNWFLSLLFAIMVYSFIYFLVRK